MQNNQNLTYEQKVDRLFGLLQTFSKTKNETNAVAFARSFLQHMYSNYKDNDDPLNILGLGGRITKPIDWLTLDKIQNNNIDLFREVYNSLPQDIPFRTDFYRFTSFNDHRFRDPEPTLQEQQEEYQWIKDRVFTSHRLYKKLFKQDREQPMIWSNINSYVGMDAKTGADKITLDKIYNEEKKHYKLGH